MSDIKVSLFASAVRPKLWPALFKSLEGTTVEYEIVFAGNVQPAVDQLHPKLNYIYTGNTKPSQCYEVSRRHCIGETVVWTADDAEYPNNVIGKAYEYWKKQNNPKLILSIQTKESGYNLPEGQLFDMNVHRFFAGNPQTPLMAPLAMMSRNLLEALGGLDRRYVCGQYENDIVMRAYKTGAKVEVFGGQDCYIDLDHLGKSLEIGESKVEADFLNRPFAKGYQIDRQVLESSWRFYQTPHGIDFMMVKDFEPYEDADLLTKSQSNNLPEMWC